MKKLPRQYSRDKRKEQIRLQFSVWHRNGDCEPKTMNRVAKALGMIPSQNIQDMLLEMVEVGDLTVEQHDRKGRWTTKFYLLVESRIITEEFHRRHISVRSRGVAVGRLEMFS